MRSNGSCRNQSDMAIVSTCANTLAQPRHGMELDERQRSRRRSGDAYRGSGTGFGGHGGGRGARNECACFSFGGTKVKPKEGGGGRRSSPLTMEGGERI